MTDQQQPLPIIPNTNDNNNPPFHSIPHLSNFRDPALLPLTTSSGALIRRGLLFRSADVSQVDESGWRAVHRLGIARVFDLRSGPELARTHGHDSQQNEKDGNGNSNSDGDGDEKSSSTLSSTLSNKETTHPGNKKSHLASPPSPPAESNPACQLAMQKAGISRSWVPVFHSADYSPDRLAERYMCYMDASGSGFVRAYKDILRNAGPAFRTILLYLAGLSPETRQQQVQGALIHCTAGKDRTGMFFGLLFDFLHVPREKIADEYQLTEQGLADLRERIVPRLMLSGAFKKYMRGMMDGNTSLEDGEMTDDIPFPPEILEQGKQAALRMVSARKESMLGALEMLDRVFGGAEAYMRKECGLLDEELEALRRNLLVVEG